jgi:riboflavin synthase
MFTGLIEDVGTLLERRPVGRSAKLRIRSGLPLGEIRVGDSICVNGACLTVEEADAAGHSLVFHCLNETLSRTNLAKASAGSLVNLERALRLGDRLGGHLVAGHVDATAPVLRVERRDDDLEVTLASPAELQDLLVSKGSIAVNGISLTIAALQAESFSVRIIPHTWERTSLRSARPGDLVNLEGDLVGKFVLRREERRRSADGTVTLEKLGEAGFV